MKNCTECGKPATIFGVPQLATETACLCTSCDKNQRKGLAQFVGKLMNPEPPRQDIYGDYLSFVNGW